MTGKKYIKKMMGLTVALFLLLLVCPDTVRAATVEGPTDLKKNFKKTVTYSKADKKEGYSFYLSDVYKKANEVKIKKVTLSKKAVGYVKFNKNLDSNRFDFYPKKTGKTKVTISLLMDGKKVTYKGTITVKKFRQPFKKLTVNGKNYRKKITGGNKVIKVGEESTVQYKLNPGWKVTKIYDCEYNKLKTKTKFKLGYDITTMCLKHKNGTEVIVRFSTMW